MDRDWVFPDQWDMVRSQGTMDTAGYNVIMPDNYEEGMEYIEDVLGESYEARVFINNAGTAKAGWTDGENAAELFTGTAEELSQVLDDELYEVERSNSRFKDNYSGRPDLVLGRKASGMKHSDLETSGTDYTRPNLGFQLFVSGQPKIAVYGHSEEENKLVGEAVGPQGTEIRGALESYFGFKSENLPNGVFDTEPHTDIGIRTAPINAGISYTDWEEPEKSMFEFPVENDEEEKEQKSIRSKLVELV